MTYQSFLIAPFATGLDSDLAPWLLPQDAFSNIVNGHVHHGAVEKREGYTKQGDMVHQDQTNWKISGITNANPGVVTVVSTAGLTNGDTVELRRVPGMTEVNKNQYIVANLAGTTFELLNVNTTPFTVYGAGTGDVMLIPGNRIMGLERYIDLSNVKEVIAFDQTRAAKYDPTNMEYAPLDSADIMDAGSVNTDYIWADNWASTASSQAVTQYRLYFTNGRPLSGGLNGIRYYNGGTTTTGYAPQINATFGGPIINGCKLLFAFKQRLVLLHTFEGANTYPQRARWCQAQGPSIADAWDDAVSGKGGFVDAPTGDHIISAKFVQDALIVYFTNSVWTLRATSDPALAFRWDKINDLRACDGKMTAEQFDRYVVAAGIRGLTATDGVETQRFDERIEDFVDEQINDSQFEKTFSKRSFGNRRMWMLYAKNESEEANASLIYDEESSAFSKYDIEMNVLGYGGAAQDSTIADFGDDTIFDFDNHTLQDYFYDEGSEIFLGGNRSGEIFILESGGEDKVSIFTASIYAVTAANPGVVTMNKDIGLLDGDIVTISGVGGMVELNNREFVVANKSGNTFQLLGEDTSGYAAYTAGGSVGNTSSSPISFSLESAAWNPWMSEGKQAQLGYIDFFLDTHSETKITVKFFTNNSISPYPVNGSPENVVNLLPNLREKATISNVTQANPAVVTAAGHGLNTNDSIYIYNVDGMQSINGGPYAVTYIDDGNFSIAVDSSNYGIYTNDGVITELPFSSTKAWKRVYAGGTGYQHKISIETEGKYTPLKIHAMMLWFQPRGRVI